MTPSEQGFVKCARCKVWRRESEVQAVGFGATTTGLACIDVAWCSSQADVGKGELDADTGYAVKPSRVLLPFTPDVEDGS